MFVTVKTNDGDVAVVNVDNITHLSIASFSGNGCRVYLTSKESLHVRETMDEILKMIGGTAAETQQQPAYPG